MAMGPHTLQVHWFIPEEEKPKIEYVQLKVVGQNDAIHLPANVSSYTLTGLRAYHFYSVRVAVKLKERRRRSSSIRIPVPRTHPARTFSHNLFISR